jgi:hypothetical protein
MRPGNSFSIAPIEIPVGGSAAIISSTVIGRGLAGLAAAGPDAGGETEARLHKTVPVSKCVPSEIH